MEQSGNFKFRVKSVDETGTFTGLGAVYGNVDLGGDVIDPGAFTRTLNANTQFPLLWQHDSSSPIGTVKITDSPAGLQVEGSLVLADPTAQKAYTFMKAGVTKGLSIGYDVLQSAMDGDVRHLTQLRLWELSVVTFPMNESAQVLNVKSLSDDDKAKAWKTIKEHQKAIYRHQRGISVALKSLADFDDDPDDDEDLTILDGGEDLTKAAEEAQAKAVLDEMRILVLAAKRLQP